MSTKFNPHLLPASLRYCVRWQNDRNMEKQNERQMQLMFVNSLLSWGEPRVPSPAPSTRYTAIQQQYTTETDRLVSWRQSRHVESRNHCQPMMLIECEQTIDQQRASEWHSHEHDQTAGVEYSVHPACTTPSVHRQANFVHHHRRRHHKWHQ